MKLKSYPKIGDRRKVKKFAWLPVIIGDLDGGCKIWLESYYEYQEYDIPYFHGYDWYLIKRERIKK